MIYFNKIETESLGYKYKILSLWLSKVKLEDNESFESF